MKITRAIAAALLIGGTMFGIAGCEGCPPNSTGGGAGFPGSKACTVANAANDCKGPTGQKCVVWAGAVCDPATLHCVVKLSGGQCAEGQTHGVTMANGDPGIVSCDVTLVNGAPKCDWTAPQACGGKNADGTWQPCCRGGCLTGLGYKCSSLNAGPGVLCTM